MSTVKLVLRPATKHFHQVDDIFITVIKACNLLRRKKIALSELFKSGRKKTSELYERVRKSKEREN